MPCDFAQTSICAGCDFVQASACAWLIMALHTLIKKGWVSNVTSAIKLDLKPGTTAPGNVSLWQYHKAAWQHRRAAGHRPLTSPKLTACCHAHSANH
eukprot:1158656-Pelagomonas_calceolata.AAC.10